MISNPTNFNHVAHMGPGDGMQVLMDLPLVSPERVCQRSSHPCRPSGSTWHAVPGGSPSHGTVGAQGHPFCPWELGPPTS